MVDSQHFDFVVIGTGPGGEGAAMRAAKAGKSVAAVERFCQVGGGCTHWATIPSKALRQAIYHMSLCNQGSIYNASIVSEGAHDSAEELRKELLKQEREADRLENVRACCDGKNSTSKLQNFLIKQPNQGDSHQANMTSQP